MAEASKIARRRHDSVSTRDDRVARRCRNRPQAIFTAHRSAIP